ncbi:hypothetical protein D8911_08380 [Levilactobacillus brevis]|nr:hypothetical protein D8911_08380 [Levilactobacillus brevis]
MDYLAFKDLPFITGTKSNASEPTMISPNTKNQQKNRERCRDNLVSWLNYWYIGGKDTGGGF